MAPPSLRIGGIAAEPAQAHAVRIQLLQQGRPLRLEGSALKALADLAPPLVIAAAPAALGGQLQRPGQTQPPPVSTAFTGPVEPLIQPGHGGRQAVGEGIIAAVDPGARSGFPLPDSLRRAGVEELGEALIGEAIGAHAAVGALQAAGPAHSRGSIGGLAGEAAELPFGIAPAPHVLHGHEEALGRIPGRVGIGDGGGDRPAVGLAHQQHGPGA